MSGNRTLGRRIPVSAIPASAPLGLLVKEDDPMVLLFRYAHKARVLLEGLMQAARERMPEMRDRGLDEAVVLAETSRCIREVMDGEKAVEFILHGDYIIEKTDRMGAEIMKAMEQKEISTYLDIAWTLLTDDQKAELCQRFYAVMMKSLNAGLEPRTREAILHYAMVIAEQELERRSEEIRAKVVTEIDARWMKHVESVVSARLAEAIAKIKTEMVRP